MVSGQSLNSFIGRIDNYWDICQFSLDCYTFLHRPPPVIRRSRSKVLKVLKGHTPIMMMTISSVVNNSRVAVVREITAYVVPMILTDKKVYVDVVSDILEL